MPVLETQSLCFNSNGTLKWSYQTGGSSISPAIGSDGTVYIGYAVYFGGTAEYSYSNCYVSAINSDGNLKWSYSTGEFLVSGHRQ